MKKIIKQLAFSTSLFALVATSAQAIDMQTFSLYHQSGLGMQFSTNSVDLVHYSTDHQYTVGVGVVPFNWIKIKDNSGNTISENQSMGYEVFLRRSFPLSEQLVSGLGINATTHMNSGKGTVSSINSDYSVSPYIFLEYAATPHVLIGSGVNLYTYGLTTYKAGGDNNQEKVETQSALNGFSVQFTYLF